MVASAVETLQPVISVCIAFLVLNTVFVVLRFISRLALKEQKPGLDDIFVILGWIVNTANCGVAFVIRHYEVIGNPPGNIPTGVDPSQLKTQLEPLLKAVYASEQLTYAGFTFPKLSILFLYLRVFEGKWFKRGAWTLIAITVGCWIAFALVAAFLCTPVAYYWDRTIPGGTCINNDHFWRAIPPFNIVTDIGAIILPIPYIWRLEAGRAKKLGIIAIFLTGGIGIITCCIRWSVYFQYSIQQLGPYNTAPLLIWAIVECSVYLIAACLPTLRPVVRAVIPKAIKDRFHSYQGTRAASRQELGRSAIRRDKSKHFSRLQDTPSEDGKIQLVRDDVEKGVASESRVTRMASRDDTYELNDIDQDDGIYRTVDITVSESTMR